MKKKRVNIMNCALVDTLAAIFAPKLVVCTGRKCTTTTTKNDEN